MVGASDRHFAAFQRLAQRVQNAWIELREFVEKQHAVMRERDFTRLGAQAAAAPACWLNDAAPGMAAG